MSKSKQFFMLRKPNGNFILRITPIFFNVMHRLKSAA